ncbi:MAG TPA: hypothetical protein VK438_09735 [Xanthobacteraceae bacterium]|nr:hypothetical protein [Xanthobacteraceae bacterium]
MPARRFVKLLAWLCLAAIVVLSLVKPSLRPVTALPHNLEHAGIFALAGLAVGLSGPLAAERAAAEGLRRRDRACPALYAEASRAVDGGTPDAVARQLVHDPEKWKPVFGKRSCTIER